MLLVLHIVIALSSLALSTLAVFSPSAQKIKISLGLATGTIATGSLIVIQTHSPLVQSCETGIIYLAIVSGLLIAASRRLSSEKI